MGSEVCGFRVDGTNPAIPKVGGLMMFNVVYTHGLS